MALNIRPNRYSGCCGGAQQPKPIAYIPPRPAPCPEPEPVEQCDGSFKAPCHCLYETFVSVFAQYACKDERAICHHLGVASSCVGGFLQTHTRDSATMLLAAHMIEVQSIQATETAARVAAASKGNALARPSGPGSAPNDYAYYALSVWGLQYWDLLESIPRTGVIVLG